MQRADSSSWYRICSWQCTTTTTDGGRAQPRDFRGSIIIVHPSSSLLHRTVFGSRIRFSPSVLYVFLAPYPSVHFIISSPAPLTPWQRAVFSMLFCARSSASLAAVAVTRGILRTSDHHHLY